MLLAVFVFLMNGCAKKEEAIASQPAITLPQEEASLSQLGGLCSDDEDCMAFCQNNREDCEEYCRRIRDDLCLIIFPLEKQEQPSLQQPEAEEGGVEPILQNFGVEIDAWDKTTNLAGDLYFSRDILFEDDYVLSKWVFVEFGAQGQRKQDSLKNIEYWFFVPQETDVRAPIGGVVKIGFFEHTQDWGISFYSLKDSEWIVSIEHVVDVKVKDGDVVRAGDVVAKAAPRVNDELAMIELAVWTGGRSIYKYCPFDFLEESLKLVYEEKLVKLARDWEEFVGKEIYAEDEWVSPGCLVDRIKEV